MKVLVRSSSFLFALAGILLPVEVRRSRTVVRRNAAGPIKVGMSAAVLRNVLERDALAWREERDRVLVGADRNNPDLIVESAAGHVRCIVVRSARYRTAGGVGIGSPVRALLRFHDIELISRETFRLNDLGLEVLVSDGAVASITVA